jgi:hypothetical protein
MNAVRCGQCGGVVRAGTEGLVRCLFCGATELTPADPPEDLEEPAGHLPFLVSESRATEQFLAFTQSSVWYPSDLRQARVTLQRLQVPAWAWSGDVETHWTGLVRAPETRSDKRPVAGIDHVHFEQMLVPSSQALRQSELGALGAYDESQLVPSAPADDPQELSELTRSAARSQAQALMVARHRDQLAAQHGLLSIHASSVVTALQGRPVLVPVWIGAFRYGERTFRFLVNGQTEVLVGKAPISPYKVAAAVAAVLLVLSLLLAVVVLLTG